MAEIQEAGTMTIGTKFDQPGFGCSNLEDVPEGFDVEVAKIIAGAMGIAEDDIEWVETPSDIREQVIEDGDVDIVVATYTINEERAQRITFAGPYYVAGQMLMTNADNDDYEVPEDIAANPDGKVCSVTGSTPAVNIEQYLASPDQLVLFDTYDKCVDALEQDQVAVVTTDNVILAGYVGEVRRRVQARRRAVHRGALRHRHHQGRHGVLRVHQRDAGRQRGGVPRRLGGDRRRGRGHRDAGAARAGSLRLIGSDTGRGGATGATATA